MTRSSAAPRRRSVAALQFRQREDDVPDVSIGKSSVGKEDRALLQETLYDLLECKRLLDQVR